jgi:hypothetical protein
MLQCHSDARPSLAGGASANGIYDHHDNFVGIGSAYDLIHIFRGSSFRHAMPRQILPHGCN